MPPLLVLPEDRITQEVRRWGEVAAAEESWYRAWRRRFVLLLLRCAVVYIAGGVLAWAGLALVGDQAQMALWGGLLLSNLGPLALGYAFWMRESGQW